LGKESLGLHPEFIATVEDASGRPTAFTRQGSLQIFPGPHAEAEREQMAAEYRRLELRLELLSPTDARKLEPSIGPAAQAVAWLPEESVVDPRLLTDAVLAAACQRGVEIRHDCAVTSVLREGNRCNGVVAGGERIAAKFVIVAAGAFSGGIDWLVRYAPTHPVRGQMLALGPKDIKLQRVLRSENGYLVPRRDGRIIAGSTLENAGFNKHVTPSGICRILDAALELVPALANAEIIETWAGLRPGTPDHLPILGPTDVEGLLIATGHYRNGIILAPVTAKLLRDWIVSGRVSMDTSMFSPLRFSASTSHTSGAMGASARY
jgi:glycine oxidase